jgi:hypothetical protein
MDERGEKLNIHKSGGIGKSEKFESLTDEEIDEALKEIGCKKCFGRGYVGWTLKNDPVLCDCVRVKKTPPLEAKDGK